MKLVFKLIFCVFSYLNYFIKKIFKRDFLLYLKILIENNSYKKINILNQTVNFFIPNELINWRVETLFTKEPETLEWIDKFSNTDEVVFWDIGANIGLYSIYAAKKHHRASIVAFEPSTSNLRVLSRNVSINNLDEQIIINQLPLAEKEIGYQKMRETEFIEGFALNTFGAIFSFDGKKKLNSKNNYKVLGTSIDFLLNNNLLKFPNYIKIDVDGIEHLILRGGLKSLSDKRLKSILIEINKDFKDQYNEILKIMENSNFKLMYKKRAEEFYRGEYSEVFNYIFEKK